LKVLRLLLVFLLALLLSAAGCGGGGGSDDSDPAGGRSSRKWTFLVYMNGANDLEEFTGLNINQMEQVGSNADINLVVQVKRINNRYDPSFADWKDTATRRFRITRDNDPTRIHSEQIGQPFDADMGRPETLQEFVRWGVENYPAQRYCLVIWNHGAGWRSLNKKAPSPITRGVSYDDVTGSHIDTIELGGAVRLPGGRKWDLIAFDSSLMQMIEVAYEIRNETRFIAGSEESPPGPGYPYDRLVARLAANANMDGRAFGIGIIDDTIAAYGANSDITHSVLDASRLDPIVSAVNDLGGALLAAKAQYGPEIKQARDLAENYSYPQNRDLLNFTQLLLQPVSGGAGAAAAAPRVADPNVQAAAGQVQAALGAAIVKNVRGTRHPNSNGLAIFLPSPASYRFIDEEQAGGFGQRYGALAFSQAAPNWQAFLVQGPQ
jgi:hypothetical protein